MATTKQMSEPRRDTDDDDDTVRGLYGVHDRTYLSIVPPLCGV